MAIAAEAGIAPPLHYVDDVNGVALMDFVEAVPLDRFPGGDVARAAALGEFARRLQETPPFPALGDWRAIVGRLLTLLESKFAEGLLAPHRAVFQSILDRLSWDEATHVSSHNDPNARNVLFDGRRLWLVDWETAYRNDPLVDVAILADNLASTPELTSQLLENWLGRGPTASEAGRLEDIRRLTRLYYAGLLIGFGGKSTEPMSDLSAPTQAEANELQRSGELSDVLPHTLLVVGKMCLAAFLADATEGG
jgi:Ser/Thr protein kinase RdoA (MazF antagonist)